MCGNIHKEHWLRAERILGEILEISKQGMTAVNRHMRHRQEGSCLVVRVRYRYWAKAYAKSHDAATRGKRRENLSGISRS